VRPWLTDKTVLIGTLFFSILLGIGAYYEFLFIAILPLVILLAWWSIKRLDLYIGFILLTVPLSINLQEFGVTSLGLYLPTEPLLFVALIIFLFRFFNGWPVDRRLFSHHISIIICLMMVWMAITTVTSYDTLVSLKFMTSRTWFIVSFFFFLGHIMLHKPEFREHMILLLLFPLSIVVVYTVIRHSGYDFSKHAGHWMMKPFFKDHTSYGAVLAMMLPPSIALLVKQDRPALSRLLIAIATGIIAIGLVLSFTRAAWISLAGVALLFIAMKIGLKLKTLISIGAIITVVICFNLDTLRVDLQRNKQDSSDNLTEHVKSISNISSDDSNLERLNRWSCAISLFQERPITGWGPGTYQFVYAPFQKSKLKTTISTNNADGGNAHSEYLGPLAEQGVLGALFVLLLILWASIVGFRLWNNLKNIEDRNIAVSIYLGLMTYFIHGVLNNYLDTDKASAPFWGFLALLVVLDIESQNQALPKATT
jgi:putative inorganic carbon (hco3(-)) transporter